MRKTILITMLFLLVLIGSVSAAAPTVGDVVGYWDLEYSGGPDLVSSTNYTNAGSITHTTGGIISNAVTNSGTATKYIDTNRALDGYKGINFWFKTSASATQGMLTQRYLATETGGDYNIFIDSAGKIELKLYYGNHPSFDSIVTSTGWNDGAWHMFTAIQNGTKVYIYLDGVFDVNGTTGQEFGNSSNELIIASYNENAAYYFGFNGLLDEVMLSDEAWDLSQIQYLYNGGVPGSDQQYPFSAGYSQEIDVYYLSPNTSVYTDETDLRGYVERNETGSFYVNYTYYVNEVEATSGQYTGAPSGDLYTLPVLSNTNFVQGDNVSFTALLVNQTDGSPLSDTITSNNVTIANRNPSGVLSWSTTTPSNVTNFTAYVTPSDSDADELNITYTVFKNGAFLAGGSTAEQTSPYSQVTLYTVDEATTEGGDNYSFKVNITDGYDTYSSPLSENATVFVSTNFTTIITNYWTSEAVTNYTVYIETNGSTTSFSSNASNILITGIDSNLNGNITIEAQNYFNRSFIDWPMNQTLTTTIYQSSISFAAYEFISNATLTGVSFTVNGTAGNPLNLSTGEFTVTATKSGYYSATKTFNVSALDQKTITVTGMSTTVINISVTNGHTGGAITNFSGWAYNVDEDYNTSFTSTTQYYGISAIEGYYALYVYAQGFVNNASNYYYFNTSAGENAVNIVLYPTKVAQFFFYDEGTLESLATFQSGEIVNFSLVGSNGYSYSGSTSNGTFRFTELAAGEYVLMYDDDPDCCDFIKRYYYLTLTDNEYYNVSLYLLDNNTYNGQTIIVNIIDQEYANVEGAIVKVLKYDPVSNTYLQVEVGQTTVEGETPLTLIKYDYFYKFIVQYNGQTVKITSPSAIINDNIIIPIDISSNLFGEFFEYGSYDINFTFNTDSNTFRVTYNDVTSAMSLQACLKVYKVTTNGLTIYNSTCSTSSAATLLASVQEINGTTYIGKFSYDGTVVRQLNHEFNGNPDLGSLGWLLQLLLTIAFAGAAAWDVSLLPVGIGSSLIIGRALSLIAIPWTAVAVIFVVSLIVAFVINNSRS